ncbi:SRPBCC family protein [Spirosoma sordidisoli]|uniref:Polyketide cyclase n=1 Tax=Spirosoma sordidisoli TaxID=2502893 RepID=A0A4Q2ULE3_9BACT|nr:SRPBCC family protein [Spirosoma sordidisoli]RYC68501.1 polyketide cyclase [Spirosoma sordidisoli]
MSYSILLWLMLAATQALAQSTDTHFSHTVSTSASPQAVWHIWTDVPNWQSWDKGLKAATLNGPFAVGTTGVLTPDRGPRSKFILTEVIEGKSYTFRTKLPLGALYVKRLLNVQNGQTAFTHEVWFTGVTKHLFGRVSGRAYRALLPTVMQTIQTRAEQQPDQSL